MSFQLRPARIANDSSDNETPALPSPDPAASHTPEPRPSATPAGRLRPSLASLLADEGVATMDQLEEALAEGLKSGERLGEVVIRRGWINEARLAELNARRWDLTFVARSMIIVDEHARALLSRAEAERVGACPVAFNDGVPLVAIADPSDERFSAVREALGGQCTFIVTTPSALAQLIAQSPEESETANVAEPEISVSAAPEPVMVYPPEVEEDETEAEALPAVEPAVLPVAESQDGSSPALEELDHLLERLVSERVRASDQLADYRRQLDELSQKKARIEADVLALESKLGQEDQLLDSMRAKLGGLTQSLPEH
jgi:hypothetical protein